MKKITILFLVLFIFLDCNKNKKDETLIFYASGKDFVKKEFIDKDGWQISLQSVLLHIRDVTITDSVVIKIYDKFFLQLKSVDYDKIKITEITKPKKTFTIKTISFSLKKTFDYDFPGYSFIIKGIAKKDKKEINFTIKFNEEIIWVVEDEEQSQNKDESIDFNFHLEYIFGSIDPIKIKAHNEEEEEIEYDVNDFACGFNFFLPFEKNGIIDVTQEDLLKSKNKNEYEKLIKALHRIAFVGEKEAKVVYTSSKF